MSARTLAEWLAFIGRQHPDVIALGLDRVREVLGRMDARIGCPTITVAGTNGKGSVCAMLEAILQASGRRVGLYSSPHLLRYNERVRIDGTEAPDAPLEQAFEAVEQARGAVPLTYFEYGTLAAFWLFARENLDALVLEVGLGGRLDAVNVLDADCAVVTNVGLDHMEYLGDTREAIGREKAGIFRAGRPAILADADPPASVLEAARRLGAPLLRLDQDFGYRAHPGQWDYWGPASRRPALAFPALRGQRQLHNAAAALAALDALRARLPVSMQDVRRGLAEVVLPGRFQVLPCRPQVILDVAHNPDAAQVLAENLGAAGFAAETLAVFGMLRDKDVAGVARRMAPRVTRWHLCTLGGPRGTDADALAGILSSIGIRAPLHRHASAASAFAAAREEAGENDKIVVFGSFLTVAEVMQSLAATRHGAGTHG
ncbi:MAG: bifunctional tetrahydrofolate synthase/dihydrofolate synthase [Betaproteobacteria bacterium]|nr:bifunctional tetrahydrofolate synthase/dihydrofolate synthase [Betaproteobacteria bacterium]MDH4322808.1 bifunctional tetrahydrofolate synthase/dihydrofolate synthase [Betaproteobacteria bacterium]MDH5212140.1 bifunctional tetrahydrofolate synthase/dihydrofolate synthase [Betaproteobacteria bacterium]